MDENKSKVPSQRRSAPKSTSMSVLSPAGLSPVDVDREWENITLFMDSFNKGRQEMFCIVVIVNFNCMTLFSFLKPIYLFG